MGVTIRVCHTRSYPLSLCVSSKSCYTSLNPRFLGLDGTKCRGRPVASEYDDTFSGQRCNK